MVYRFGSVLRKPNGNFNLTPTVCMYIIRVSIGPWDNYSTRMHKINVAESAFSEVYFYRERNSGKKTSCSGVDSNWGLMH